MAGLDFVVTVALLGVLLLGMARLPRRAGECRASGAGSAEESMRPRSQRWAGRVQRGSGCRGGRGDDTVRRCGGREIHEAADSGRSSQALRSCAPGFRARSPGERAMARGIVPEREPSADREGEERAPTKAGSRVPSGMRLATRLGTLLIFSEASWLDVGEVSFISRPTPSPEAFDIALPPRSGITISIKSGMPAVPGKPCYIVISKRYQPTLSIKSGERSVFDFSCQNPEKHFVIDIQKNVDCMSGPCPFGKVELQPSTSSLPALNRTFMWDVRAPKNIGLELQFSTPYLRQIGPGESCPDRITYSINGCIDTTTVRIGTFCSNGTVSRIKMQEGVNMTLHLPWWDKRNVSGFSIANQSSIKRLCIIESVFEDEGSATLMSANYPDGFPEDELMTWQFIIPLHLRASVSFLTVNVSNCVKKEERVEYYIPGSTTNPEVFKLRDQQPGNMAGNFNLSLQGCDQDPQNPGILRLQFQVLVQHPQNESNKTYLVDLSNEHAMSLTIALRSDRMSHKFVPGCFVCLESRTCSTNLTLTSGSKHKISFLCDNLNRLWMKAEKIISCTDHRFCHRKSYHLQVPKNILQLPVQLHDFSWKLLVPKDKVSLALVPTQKLQQSTSERICNTSFSYLVASAVPGQDLYFGFFCPGGSIEQIQVKQNISVSFRTFKPDFHQEVSRQDLTVSFIPHLKEDGIFTVTPDTKSKIYLKTPSWGLPPLTSVSWNVSVPTNQVACLTFLKEHTDVVCQTGRAFMIIQEQQTHAEEIFNLEDGVLPKPSLRHHNFWVNISNCSPVSGKQLDVLFWVTLTPKTIDLTIVIIAVGGGTLLLCALGLILCYWRRKKKEVNKGPVVGIYNGNVNTQMPRQQKKFQKGRKDNDSHVYAVIDDTMVYGHLLQDSNGSFLQPEVDTYRPFEGPMEDCPPSLPSVCSKAPTRKLASEEHLPCFSPESESEPYTFSYPNNGNMGPGNMDIPLQNIQEPEEPADPGE
ncbi:CUB domain-containing protein 1 [Orycteropus afer afer]|uniref:CUB domain-containing protein 1 n=1 Tax=Orycteropus afer afer TaxID=1230840 RepID=A0A8B7AJ40_ORYAF|nr:CUB domain-containing protein 1 [Orycteropus afer afer]